ncbi:MAG: acylphosphatase [Methanotrichaceae archaeon]|nr:acylphosphatase [Methanotrichaceae archaeon]
MKLQARIIGSRVHDVGYRVFILHGAMELGFQRFSAKNCLYNGNQYLIVTVEGEESQLAEFKKLAETRRPKGAEVSKIEFCEFKGHVMSVEDFMHISMVEQLNKGIPLLLRMDDKLGSMDNKLSSMDNKLSSMDNKLSSIDCKQDKLLEGQDKIMRKQDASIELLKGVKDDTSAIREDLSRSPPLEEKVEELSRQIAEIKMTLSSIESRIAQSS